MQETKPLRDKFSKITETSASPFILEPLQYPNQLQVSMHQRGNKDP